MKKILIFWLISTICAAAMYAFGLRDENAANLALAAGFVAYGVPFAVTLVICIVFGGVPKSLNSENFIYSWLIVAATATMEYGIIYRLMECCSLFYSIPAALVSGFFLVWMLEVIRTWLHQMSCLK